MFHSLWETLRFAKRERVPSDPILRGALITILNAKRSFVGRTEGSLRRVAADRGQIDGRGGRKSGIYLSDCARGLRGLFFQKTRVFVGGAHKFAESGEPPCEVPFVQAYEHPRRKWRGNYVSSLARASVITFPFLLVT